jgi:DNA-directed RNA polymerase specialized sigma24 family protein
MNDATPRPGTNLQHLNRLVLRTAAGDRAAFRCLYAGLARPVWRIVAVALPDPDTARPVFDSTFVELWHRAGSFDNATGTVRAWVISIASRRAGDRLRAREAPGPSGITRRGPTVDDIATAYDCQVRDQLRSLLGAGQVRMWTSTGAWSESSARRRLVGSSSTEDSSPGATVRTRSTRDSRAWLTSRWSMSSPRPR